jgi:hypothetical protein
MRQRTRSHLFAHRRNAERVVRGAMNEIKPTFRKDQLADEHLGRR